MGRWRMLLFLAAVVAMCGCDAFLTRVGEVGQPCSASGACRGGLVCLDKVCVDPASRVRDGGRDRAPGDRVGDRGRLDLERDSNTCSGVECDGTCYPAGRCCQASDCGSEGWSCTAGRQCECPGIDCGDGRCRPAGPGYCCAAADCGTGVWSCGDDELCRCDRATCGDGYCPGLSDCCSGADCVDPSWSCNAQHRCDCSGGVGCADGFCRPTEAVDGCCEVSDCGSGNGWSCDDHLCVCPGLRCGAFCALSGECCAPEDCLADATRSGAWLCGSSNLCSCAQTVCGDNHCPAPGECCGLGDCSAGGAWRCDTASHSCVCDGTTCGDEYCDDDPAECCVASDCGQGAWSCESHQCRCPNGACTDGFCRQSQDDCCPDTVVDDCGTGAWGCSGEYRCACELGSCVADSYCRNEGECCAEDVSGGCGAGAWECSVDHMCLCPGDLCVDGFCRGTETTGDDSCCVNTDCTGVGEWVCSAEHTCECETVFCSNPESCLPPGVECCTEDVQEHCGPGFWSCRSGDCMCVDGDVCPDGFCTLRLGLGCCGPSDCLEVPCIDHICQ